MSTYSGIRFDSPHESHQEPAHVRTFDELETHVQTRLVGRVHQFRLEIRGKGLVLRGCAHTYYAKQLAQHAVMEATDVPILSNAIAVS